VYNTPTPVVYPRVSVQSGAHHLVMITKETSKETQTLRLKTTVSNENTKAYQYYFIRGTTTAAVSGDDDSSSNSYMYCNPFDVVKVFINTVELDKSLYSVQENKIIFTEPLAGERNVIKVFVYKPEAIRNYLLTFNKPSNTFNESAWGNVKKILLNNEIYDVFVSTGVVDLTLGGQYLLSDGVTENQIDLANTFFIFANKPYSSYDRLMSSVIDLTQCAANKYVFEYGVDEFSEVRLTLRKDQLTEIFPPIKIVERNRYSSDFVIESGNVTRSDVETKKIIGPV